jgi:hypothetical protein
MPLSSCWIASMKAVSIWWLRFVSWRVSPCARIPDQPMCCFNSTYWINWTCC